MIRVLHMIGSLNYGGSQTFVLSMQKQLASKDIVFDLIIDRPTELQLKNQFEQLGSKVFVLPQFKGYNILTYLFAWFSFFKSHPEYKVIHGHVRSTAALYLGVAKLFGLFTIAHSHSTNSGTGFKAKIKDFLQYFIKYVADFCFACSDEAGEWLFGETIVKSNRYKTIINGIDFKEFAFDLELRTKYRQKINALDGPVIGHVGRFNEAKNHLFLIQVFSEILNIIPTAILLLIGNKDSEEYPETIDEIKHLNIQDSVRIIGPSHEISNWLNAMDCFVFPSKWEGFGIAALEAQANGLMTYVSTCVPDDILISDNATVLNLEAGPNEWAKVILDNGFSRGGSAYDERYDITRVAEWMSDFYRRCSNS